MLRTTAGWRLAGYRWTGREQRRARFLSPENELFEECDQRYATHVRRFRGLSPVYLRRIQVDEQPRAGDVVMWVRRATRLLGAP